MSKRYLVDARWDEEARVWVASSDEVLGLCTEADFNRRKRMEELIQHAGTCNALITAEELQAQRRQG